MDRTKPPKIKLPCSVCRKCKSSCICQKAPKSYAASTMPLATDLPTNQSMLNPLKRNLGVEVEIGKFKTQLARSTYKTQNLIFTKTSDGSVKPEGHELVIEPSAGDKFVRGALELFKLLKFHGAEVNETCGMHVHVDSRDLEPPQVQWLLKTYVMYENEIYKMLPACRQRNQYCHKFQTLFSMADVEKGGTWTKSKMYEIFFDFGYSPSELPAMKELYPLVYKYKYDKYRGRARYCGLNINSHMHRGTIEWRHHQGTVAIKDLVLWPLFCGWFVEMGIRPNTPRPPSLAEFVKVNMPAAFESYISTKLSLATVSIDPITIEKGA